MFAIVSLKKLELRPGTVLRMPATWEEYEHLSDQRGDGSIPRIKYRDGEMLLMSPLPKHGRDAHLIASIITTLLDHDEREYVYQLQGTEYEVQSQSRYFPDIDLQETIAQCLKITYERNTSAAIRQLRNS